MPQLSLYIDDEFYLELEIRACLSNASKSKFVIGTLKAYFSKSRPDGFQNLYGSVTDESFVKQEAPEWSSDAPRESL